MARVPESPVCLLADDLVLRPATEADLEPLAAAFHDPLIRRWNPLQVDDGAGDAVRKWMERRNDWSAGDHLSWLMSDMHGRVLGSVSLHHVDLEHENAEVGYWVASQFRGRRLSARGVDVAARFAFETLGFRRLYLYHSVDNPASCRAAERAGFELEGTLRQSYRYADGRFHDEHLHGRLATDEPRSRAIRKDRAVVGRRPAPYAAGCQGGGSDVDR